MTDNHYLAAARPKRPLKTFTYLTAMYYLPAIGNLLLQVADGDIADDLVGIKSPSIAMKIGVGRVFGDDFGLCWRCPAQHFLVLPEIECVTWIKREIDQPGD